MKDNVKSLFSMQCLLSLTRDASICQELQPVLTGEPRSTSVYYKQWQTALPVQTWLSASKAQCKELHMRRQVRSLTLRYRGENNEVKQNKPCGWSTISLLETLPSIISREITTFDDQNALHEMIVDSCCPTSFHFTAHCPVPTLKVV